MRRRRSFYLAFALVLLLLAILRYTRAHPLTNCLSGPSACALSATSSQTE
ncbi:MAG: hypothetical protein IT298_11885 [Chloroflexi bacterium]|jgi:hypothetical protein|nr:hypothetical protein [Anaerolineae bacterium]MCC6566452.1 hypothetical protein [Chloroflexota bacterium]MCO6445393.1 hypothetical protein [Anaerolineae bacterium]NOG48053.1 hypothetical protein [Chloroflexota bacterium]